MIFVEAVTRYRLYLYHTSVTFYEMTISFLPAATVGLFLGAVIIYSCAVRNLIYPQILVFDRGKSCHCAALADWAG